MGRNFPPEPDLRIARILSDYVGGLSLRECGYRHNTTMFSIRRMVQRYMPLALRRGHGRSPARTEKFPPRRRRVRGFGK